MTPTLDESPKPRTSRSKAARTALWDKLRESPSNAAGFFDPLTPADFDSLIETVPARWKWAYEAVFDVAMQFETDGKTGRLYWNTVCNILRLFREWEANSDRNDSSGLGGFFNLMRESLRKDQVEIVVAIVECVTAMYRHSIANLMQKAWHPPKTPRKTIPKEAIQQLHSKLAKTEFRRKGELVQNLADRYGVTRRTIYRRLEALNHHS
jgi:hypothetical protein